MPLRSSQEPSEAQKLPGPKAHLTRGEIVATAVGVAIIVVLAAVVDVGVPHLLPPAPPLPLLVVCVAFVVLVVLLFVLAVVVAVIVTVAFAVAVVVAIAAVVALSR